jgi:hypothetical protein
MSFKMPKTKIAPFNEVNTMGNAESSTAVATIHIAGDDIVKYCGLGRDAASTNAHTVHIIHS